MSENDISQQAFIKSASMHILTALIDKNQNTQDSTLVAKAVNLAYSLNEELTKRFKQK